MDVPTTRYTKLGTDRIAYQVLGDSPIDVVWHGPWYSHIDGRWEEPNLARLYRRLASFSRLILFDRRGTGASDPLPEGATATWEDWVDDVQAVMAAAGSESAAIIASADAGATAILFAATYPERTSALILFTTSARFLAAEDYPIGCTEEAYEAVIAFSEEAWGTDALIDVIAPSMAKDTRFREWWGRYQRMAGGPQTNTRMMRTTLGLDARFALATLRVPTLVLARRDFQFAGMRTVEHARYLAEHIKGARYVELDGAEGIMQLGDADTAVDEIQEFLTGVRPPPEADRMLATIMFTDIVGSTERAASLGDKRWRPLLDAHDREVREQLRRFSGREIRTTGDGFLACFDGPARAIRCAQATTEATRALGVDVRAGLHTGECEVRGEDLGGLAVHIAARVGALAQPGQVLVSRTVADLVAGSGIEFEDRGEHELKGVPGRWRLYSVAR